jgi:hypothetical protein
MADNTTSPVELKVKVGSVAAALSALLLGFGAEVLPGGTVPAWVSAPVLAVITGVVTFAASWLARHTPRGLADVEVDTAPPVPPQAGPTAAS